MYGSSMEESCFSFIPEENMIRKYSLDVMRECTWVEKGWLCVHRKVCPQQWKWHHLDEDGWHVDGVSGGVEPSYG